MDFRPLDNRYELRSFDHMFYAVFGGLCLDLAGLDTLSCFEYFEALWDNLQLNFHMILCPCNCKFCSICSALGYLTN